MKSEVKLRNRENEVFVKEIKYEISNTDIVKSSMEEHQIPQAFKLMNSKVRVL